MDRERIEREARDIVRNYREDSFPSCGELQDAIAALVAREVEQAALEEREACAKVCGAAERLALRNRSSEGARTALDCAAAIRDRSAQVGGGT